MKANINKTLFYSIDNNINNSIHRFIYRNPRAGQLGGWAFALVKSGLGVGLGTVGLIENIALGAFNALYSAFNDQAKKDFKANLVNIKTMSFNTFLSPIIFIVRLIEYHTQAAEDKKRKTKESWQPIHFAAAYNDTKSLERLLKSEGVDLNLKTNKISTSYYSTTTYFETPLHLAERCANPQCVALLMKAGANPSITNTYGLTPLESAILSEKMEVVKALIENGDDVKRVGISGETILHTAIKDHHSDGRFSISFKRSNYEEVIEYLVKKGADINAKDRRGHSPLIYALDRGKEIIQALVKNGADINSVDEHGLTAAFYATNPSSCEALEFLASLDNFDINKQDEHGQTVLHKAATKVTPETVLILAKNPRLNPNIQDDQGRTALHYIGQKIACLQGMESMKATIEALFTTAEALLKLPGVDQDLVDGEGKKAADYISDPLSPKMRERFGIEFFGEHMWSLYNGRPI